MPARTTAARRRTRPLQMSLSAAQIFVETPDFAAVEEVVAQALADWASGVGELPAGPDGPQFLERHAVMIPPVDGWIAIVEPGGRVDRHLAPTSCDRWIAGFKDLISQV